MHQLDVEASGFEWIDCHDSEQSVLSFLRKDASRREVMLIVCNFTPVTRHNYRVGVPFEGRWVERLNSDATLYGGSGQGNFGGVTNTPLPAHGRPWSLTLTVPPLGVVVFKHQPVGCATAAEALSQAPQPASPPRRRRPAARP
jgi:1,4-alpha-glucan branching enzyme